MLSGRLMRTNRDSFFSEIPLFFKIWIGFIAFMGVATIGITIWAAISLATDPGQVGRFAGEIVRGYNETSGQ